MITPDEIEDDPPLHRTSVSLDIVGDGSLRVTEWHPVDKGHPGVVEVAQLDDVPAGGHTETLIDTEVNDMRLSVAVREDEFEGVYLQLSSYHHKATEDGRTFSVGAEVVLTLEDVKRLGNFCGFLLMSGLDGVAHDSPPPPSHIYPPNVPHTHS
jgi:hypothetical protein